jgi:tRNA(fMet)-specific endonuclease VapC
LSQIPRSISNELALDTNVAIELLNHPANSLVRVGEATNLALPVVVVGELIFGARKSSRIAENLARVDDFIRRARVLTCDLDTARIFADVRLGLRRKGKRILEDDMWIASSAIQWGLPLATRDIHFSYVDGLQVVSW